LEEKVRTLFLAEEGTPDLRNKLRQLGDDREITATLMQLAGRYRHAREGFIELNVLHGVVAVLGDLRANAANELLLALLADRKVHQNVRALAARSLGQIDPEENMQTLLRALNDASDFYRVRVYAAEGLAKTSDGKVLAALERYSREERDSHVRQQFEKAAQAMRDNGVKPN